MHTELKKKTKKTGAYKDRTNKEQVPRTQNTMRKQNKVQF